MKAFTFYKSTFRMIAINFLWQVSLTSKGMATFVGLEVSLQMAITIYGTCQIWFERRQHLDVLMHKYPPFVNS